VQMARRSLSCLLHLHITSWLLSCGRCWVYWSQMTWRPSWWLWPHCWSLSCCWRSCGCCCWSSCSCWRTARSLIPCYASLKATKSWKIFNLCLESYFFVDVFLYFPQDKRFVSLRKTTWKVRLQTAPVIFAKV